MSEAPPKRRAKVLIVDDEKAIREVIAEVISEQYEPILAASGEEGIAMAQAHDPVVILMDIIMDGMGGIEACKRLRSHAKTRHIPVIMLSAAGQRENRIKSFDLGADDFVHKPFDTDELLSRIHAKVRRRFEETKGGHRKQRVCANLVLDDDRRSAAIDGNDLALTQTEFDLLNLLVRREGKIVSRADIIKKVWKDAEGSDRRIDAHMVALRKRLEAFYGTLETVYGQGYLLKRKA